MDWLSCRLRRWLNRDRRRGLFTARAIGHVGRAAGGDDGGLRKRRRCKPSGLPWPGRRLKSDAGSLLWIGPIVTLFAKPDRKVLRLISLASALALVSFSGQ